MGKDFDRLVGQVVASGALSKSERARRIEAAKQARRAERRKRKQEDDARAKAEIWDDRDGKARPTEQRRLKGVFRLREGDDAGVSIAVDEASCTVDRLHASGVITDRQREAGHGFEATARGVLGSPAGRSCCDMTPVGHDGDGDDDGAIEARRRWDSLRRMLRPDDRRELVSVCWEGHRPVSLDRLRRALDATGDWMGLERRA